MYSNGDGSASWQNNYVNGIYTGMKWQCVEYVRRYYLSVYGLDLASLHRGDAKTFYDNASKMKLSPFPNGGSVSPQIGDILVSNYGDYGHVAIVRSVSANQVCTVQQNVTSDYRDLNRCSTLTVSNGKYTVGAFNFNSNYKIQGWLRAPDKLTVYDFWRKADPLYADPSSSVWYPNFDAQYKVRNDGSKAVTIKQFALSIHDSANKFLFDMKNPSTGQSRFYNNITLYPGQYQYFEFSVAYFTTEGNYKVVAKAQMSDGTWNEMASQDFRILAKVTTGGVYGKLRDGSATGAALSGATVTCGGKTTATGLDGSYTFIGLSAGTYMLTFSKTGYQSYSRNVTISSGQNFSAGDNYLTKIVSKPNLTPYKPSNWSDKIVVSKTTGTSTDSSPLYSTDTLYGDFAFVVYDASISNAFYTELYVDGVKKNTWSTSSLAQNSYSFVSDYYIGKLSRGTHTIKVKVDSASWISESNESDNEYTKTITVY